MYILLISDLECLRYVLIHLTIKIFCPARTIFYKPHALLTQLYGDAMYEDVAE